MDDEPGFQITVTRRIKHDLRTPLNQILGFTELLQEELADEGRTSAVEDLGKIHAAGTGLLRALESLFDPERHQEVAELAQLTPCPEDSRPPGAARSEPAPEEPLPPGEAARFLVVDDNDTNREILARRLKQAGHSVASAADGYEALEILDKENFDLVLLDVTMPGLSGFDVLRKIRETRSPTQLPVIMATARDQSQDVLEALHAGANDYVTKPLNFPVLLARARTHLAVKRLARRERDFMQIAGHDIKNPLTVIMGGVRVIETKFPDAQQATGLIRRAAQIIQKIISNFLDFGALADGQVVLDRLPIDLNQIARETVATNAGRAEVKGIALESDLDPELPKVRADAVRMEQVLQNLVGNAIKFGRNGDTVLVRSFVEGGDAVIEVRDSGPGLLPEDMAKLFVKYARLSNKPTGGEASSGLGLAICRDLVELHGGRIGAGNNDPEPGATFWFRVPIG